MAIIVGNSVGGVAPLKTLILEDPSGLEIIGVVTESEQVFNARPQDIRIGKIAVTDNGVVEGTNTITYRTESGFRLIEPGNRFSIPFQNYDQYDYTKFQCSIVKYSSDYTNNAESLGVSIGNNIFSTSTTEILGAITPDLSNKSIDLGFDNTTAYSYFIFYFTYREEVEE